MSFTKISLGGNNYIIYKLFPPRDSLVSDIPAGDRNIEKLFLQCTSTCLNLSKTSWKWMNLHESPWTWLNLLEPAWSSLKQTELCLNLSESLKKTELCLNLSEFLKQTESCLNLSESLKQTELRLNLSETETQTEPCSESIFNSLKQTELRLNISETPWSRLNPAWIYKKLPEAGWTLPEPVQNSLKQIERCLLEFDYACLTLSEPATASWTCLILSEPAWFLNCLNLPETPWWLSELVWTCLNLPETVWNSLNLPQPFLTGFKSHLEPYYTVAVWTCLQMNTCLDMYCIFVKSCLKLPWTHMSMPDCLHLPDCLQTCLHLSSTYTIYICVHW